MLNRKEYLTVTNSVSVSVQTSLRDENQITWATVAQDFYSYSRRNNRLIASYVTIVTTPKTDKKTSELFKLFRDRSLVSFRQP